MLFMERPKGFDPKIEVVSCFVENDSKILLLLRQDNKPQGNTWGVPAGKVEMQESLLDALKREVLEEAGLIFEKDPQYIKETYVRYPDLEFIYHIFHIRLPCEVEIRIDPEAHKEYKWVHPKEALNMPLIEDEDTCIKLFYFPPKT